PRIRTILKVQAAAVLRTVLGYDPLRVPDGLAGVDGSHETGRMQARCVMRLVLREAHWLPPRCADGGQWNLAVSRYVMAESTRSDKYCLQVVSVFVSISAQARSRAMLGTATNSSTKRQTRSRSSEVSLLKAA